MSIDGSYLRTWLRTTRSIFSSKRNRMWLINLAQLMMSEAIPFTFQPCVLARRIFPIQIRSSTIFLGLLWRFRPGDRCDTCGMGNTKTQTHLGFCLGGV